MWKKIKKILSPSAVNQYMVLGEERIEYVLIRDTYKTLRLRVRADASIEVKAPKRYRQEFIDDFLQRKAVWIREKRRNALEKGVKPLTDFSHEAPCFCLGKEFVFYYSHMGDEKIIHAIENYRLRNRKIKRIKSVFASSVDANAVVGFAHSNASDNFTGSNASADFASSHAFSFSPHSNASGFFTESVTPTASVDFVDKTKKSHYIPFTGATLAHTSLDSQNNTEEHRVCVMNPFELWQSDASINKGQFLYGEKIYQDFWDIGNNVHHAIALLDENSLSRLSEKSNPTLSGRLDFSNPDSLSSSSSINLDSFVNSEPTNTESINAQSLIFIKEMRGVDALRSLHIWRKKTAELFLKICLDTVWGKLCGDIQSTQYHDVIDTVDKNDEKLDISLHRIPKEVQEIFRKIEKPSLRIRVLSRRFGSCSSKGEICLACHLISFPLDLIESVIIHECCHLIHMNHSKSFYALLTMCCAGAREKHTSLLDWSRNHSNF